MTFRGTVERYGRAGGRYPQRTLLLRDVVATDTREVVTDHLWLKVGKRIGALGELARGTVVEFDARVKPYWKQPDVEYVELHPKGDWTRQVDYKLAWPTHVRVVEDA